MLFSCLGFFFFKQRTAYEWRISAWSSDVCSSDLACVTHGAAMVYPAPGCDPVASLRSIANERCTHCYGVPTMFIAMLAVPDFGAYDLGSLRGGIMAGATCPVEVMRRVIDRMHMGDITIAYGMTETNPVRTQTLPADPLAAPTATVGLVIPPLTGKIAHQAS